MVSKVPGNNFCVCGTILFFFPPETCVNVYSYNKGFARGLSKVSNAAQLWTPIYIDVVL